MLFKKPMKKATLFVLTIFLAMSFSACDKIPFLQNNPESETDSQGIVQTDWQSEDEAAAALVLEAKKDSKSLIEKPVALSDTTESYENTAKTAPAPSGQVKLESGDYAVQIGAFLVADNATRMVKKLRKKGYNANLTVVTTPAKKWNLVRIGAYPDKKSAVEAARKFTSAEKMETAVVRDRTIVKMQTNAEKQAAAKKTAMVRELALPMTVAKFEPERFTFQVGGLRTRQNAKKHQLDLKKKGYKPYLKKIKNHQSSETWYSIRIGTYDDIDLAAEAASAFTAKEAIPARAVSINN